MRPRALGVASARWLRSGIPMQACDRFQEVGGTWAPRESARSKHLCAVPLEQLGCRPERDIVRRQDASPFEFVIGPTVGVRVAKSWTDPEGEVWPHGDEPEVEQPVDVTP